MLVLGCMSPVCPHVYLWELWGIQGLFSPWMPDGRHLSVTALQRRGPLACEEVKVILECAFEDRSPFRNEGVS